VVICVLEAAVGVAECKLDDGIECRILGQCTVSAANVLDQGFRYLTLNQAVISGGFSCCYFLMQLLDQQSGVGLDH
jgi:hypothetical protein